MDGSIRVSPTDRKSLLGVYRSGLGVRSRRAHVILLASDGWSVREIRACTYTSFDFITATLTAFREDGLAVVTRETTPRPLPRWASWVARWLARKTPEDFGFIRRRWSCEIMATVLSWKKKAQVSTETVRRVMRRLGYVWRRPRPVVGPVDPDRDAKLREIQAFLRDLPADETAVFQDEVDIHLNPKIGSCWMRRGEQAEVVTPGNNEKRHLAGSLVWRTGTLVVGPPGTRRNADLFVAHLDDLRVRFRHVRKSPRHLRQRRLPPGPPGPGLPAGVGAPDRPALPAPVRPGHQPDRAGLVAVARNRHPEPPVPDARRLALQRLQLVRAADVLLRQGPRRVCHRGVGALRS
jgi:transposase